MGRMTRKVQKNSCYSLNLRHSRSKKSNALKVFEVSKSLSLIPRPLPFCVSPKRVTSMIMGVSSYGNHLKF